MHALFACLVAGCWARATRRKGGGNGAGMREQEEFSVKKGSKKNPSGTKI
jgi:hypothetical protein